MSDRVFKQVFNEINDSKAPLNINNLNDNTESKVYEVQGMREFVDSSEAVGEAIDKGIDLALEPETIGSAGQILHNIDIVGLERMLQMRYKKQVAQEALSPEMTFVLINALVVLFGFFAKSMGWIEKSTDAAMDLTNKNIKGINAQNERLEMQLERELQDVREGKTTRDEFEKKWKETIQSKANSLNTNVEFYIVDKDRTLAPIIEMQTLLLHLLDEGKKSIGDVSSLLQDVVTCLKELDRQEINDKRLSEILADMDKIFNDHAATYSPLLKEENFKIFKTINSSNVALHIKSITDMTTLKESLDATKEFITATIANGHNVTDHNYNSNDVNRIASNGLMDTRDINKFEAKCKSIVSSSNDAESVINLLVDREVQQITDLSKHVLEKHKGDDIVRSNFKKIDEIVKHNLMVIKEFLSIIAKCNSFIINYIHIYLRVYKEMTAIIIIHKALEKR